MNLYSSTLDFDNSFSEQIVFNMEDNKNEITETKTKNFFANLCKYCCFLCSTNYWFEDFNFSPNTVKILDAYFTFTSVLVTFYIAMEWAANFTQNNLNYKQTSDLLVFCISHTLFLVNTTLFANKKEKVKKILFNLVVKFKTVYNDIEIEKHMITKAKIFNTVFAGFCSLVQFLYTFDAVVQILTRPDGTFTTTITAWPDVKDQQPLADVARAFFYICWFLIILRMTAMYLIVISMIICLEHQFKNLCSYFENLNNIFENYDTQEEKEWKYEEAVKIGIKLHDDTLMVTRLVQEVSDTVIGGQIILNVTVIALLLTQMANSERSAANTVTILCTAICVLLAGTGSLMWNAGDVTVEASRLSTSIFLSGWHHCRGAASVRVRKLLITAMTVSQKPVILKSFGLVHISYDSYMTITKSSYSIFSVLY